MHFSLSLLQLVMQLYGKKKKSKSIFAITDGYFYKIKDSQTWMLCDKK